MSAQQNLPPELLVELPQVAQEINRLHAIAQCAISLLESYMTHVIDCEGVDLLDHISKHSAVKFSRMDLAILEEMAERIRDRRACKPH